MAMPRRASAGGSSRKRDALEGAERVAGGERARGGGDQGVHRDRLLHRTCPMDRCCVSECWAYAGKCISTRFAALVVVKTNDPPRTLGSCSLLYFLHGHGHVRVFAGRTHPMKIW